MEGNEISTLTAFINSTVAEYLLAKMALMALVVAIFVSLMIKVLGAEQHKKWLAPNLALSAGLIAGYGAVGFQVNETLLGLGTGVLIGLTAIGVVSAAKNGKQAMNNETNTAA